MALALIAAEPVQPPATEAAPRPAPSGRVDGPLHTRVSCWDRSRRLVWGNLAFRQQYGLAAAQLAGRPMADVVGTATEAAQLGHFAAALAGEERHVRQRVTRADASSAWVEAAFLPDVDDDGTVTGVQVVSADVTAEVEERDATARSIEEHRALARSLPGSFVLLFDPDLRFKLADGPALALLGLSPEQVEGRRLGEVMPDRARELYPRCRGALRGESSSWERRVAGRVIVKTAAPVRDAFGNVIAGMVIGRDVTEVRQQEATDHALRAIASATANGAGLSEVAALVATAVRDLFEGGSAGVVRFVGGRVEVVAVEPPSRELTEPFGLFECGDESAVGQVAATGVAHVGRYGPDSLGGARQLFDLGLVAGAAVPVRVHGEVWGAISLGLRTDPSAHDEVLARLAEFAEAVATHISSTDAWERLQALAATDGLTGLPNRRSFEEQLQTALASRRRHHHPVSVVLLDLDHFKAVNDNHGHATGDRVLAEAAARMHEVTRKDEVLARLGGEEFALLLPRAGGHQAPAAAERLRRAVAARPIDGLTVTVSAGTATLDSGGGDADGLLSAADADGLLAAADAAMYRSKAAGRNRVTAG